MPLRSSAVAWHTALKDTLREWLRRLGVDALEEVGVGAPKLWKRRRTERTRRCVQHVRTRRAVRHADGAERGAEHDSVGTKGVLTDGVLRTGQELSVVKVSKT